MITNVESGAMMGALADVVSNAASTASIVAGGAPAIMAPVPAGTDEASALASANTGVHSANFLATSAAGFVELVQYAAVLGGVDAAFTATDTANATQFA